MSYSFAFLSQYNLLHFPHVYDHSWIAMYGIQKRIFWALWNPQELKIWASLGSWLCFLSKTGKIRGAWCPVSVITDFGSWRQKHQKLGVFCDYIISSCPAWATWNPVTKHTNDNRRTDRQSQVPGIFFKMFQQRRKGEGF